MESVSVAPFSVTLAMTVETIVMNLDVVNLILYCNNALIRMYYIIYFRLMYIKSASMW